MTELKQCFLCGNSDDKNVIEVYDYSLCISCKSNLGLLQDNTIKKHRLAFEKRKNINPALLSYEEEVANRIEVLDKDYIKTRIKLFHIQMRLRDIV